jgi:hypothetical protein
MADLTKQPVQAEPFNFTKYTGIGAAAGTALLAAYTVIKKLLDEAPDPLIGLGLFIAAGLFALAVAITAGADVLARAYVTSHTTADPDDATKAIPASVALARAMDKDREEPKIVSMPRVKGVEVQGQSATLLAMKISGDKTEFQIKRKDQSEPEWVDPVALEF